MRVGGSEVVLLQRTWSVPKSKRRRQEQRATSQADSIERMSDGYRTGPDCGDDAGGCSVGLTELSQAVAPLLLPPDQQLARTIEAEIIPRLMLSHRIAAVPSGAIGLELPLGERPEPRVVPSVGLEDVAELARLLIAHEPEAGRGLIDGLLSRGLPLEAVFLDLVTPAARMLGELWLADRCTFTDVTVGLSRLQTLITELAPGFERELGADPSAHRVLLAPAPGEQHILGVQLASEFFRRAGWEVDHLPASSAQELTGYLSQNWVSMIGLSVSNDELLDGLGALIEGLREQSMNRRIFVMVGGRSCTDHPERVRQAGVDVVARDAREAVRLAGEFLDAHTRKEGT